MRRHVAITGGSSGIGLAIAAALAEAGVRLTLIARRADVLREAIEALPGDGHRALPFDVSDESAWEGCAGDLADVDGLVCAAAVLGPIGPSGECSPTQFRRTLEINLMGTMLAIHHCLPALASTRGAVVTFSGGGATAPLRRYDAYACSKAAVVRLTENMAADLHEDGIRINCVAPGFVATEIHRQTIAAGPSAAGENYYQRTQEELARGGVPASEAVALVEYLLRDSSEVPFSGRLISAHWDPWSDPAFRARLENESDLATLRRIDDMAYARTARA